MILLLGGFGDYGITRPFYVSPASSGTKDKLVVYKSINGIPVFRFLAFLNCKGVREQDELVQAMKARKTLGFCLRGTAEGWSCGCLARKAKMIWRS